MPFKFWQSESGQSEKQKGFFGDIDHETWVFINTTAKTRGLQSVRIFALAVSRLSLDVKMLDGVVDARK